MDRYGGTVGVWIVSLASLSLAGLIVAAFVMMAFGLDPSEVVTAGVEPWFNALMATGAFAGLAIATGLSLWLWHFTRFRLAALIMTVLEAGCVVWACVSIYQDYF